MRGGDIKNSLHLGQSGSALDLPQGDVREKWLDRLSMVLIFVNTVFMGVEAELRMRAAIRDETPPLWLWCCNVGFVIAFGLELSTKAAFFGRQLCRQNCGWNIFDLFLVICLLIDVVFEVLNISFLRSLRVVRAIKVTRALQAIQHMHHLRLMVASIITSLPSLAWAFVLLMMLLYLREKF